MFHFDVDTLKEDRLLVSFAGSFPYKGKKSFLVQSGAEIHIASDNSSDVHKTTIKSIQTQKGELGGVEVTEAHQLILVLEKPVPEDFDDSELYALIKED